jgi:hypothetical protein
VNVRVLLVALALVGMPVVAFGWARSSRFESHPSVADQLARWLDAHPGYHCRPTIQEQGPTVETFICNKGMAQQFLILPTWKAPLPAPSATAIAQRIERMPVPPFNVVRFVDVRCTISRYGSVAACTGFAKSPQRTSTFRQAFSFQINPDGSLHPVCGASATSNAFCMS